MSCVLKLNSRIVHLALLGLFQELLVPVQLGEHGHPGGGGRLVVEAVRGLGLGVHQPVATDLLAVAGVLAYVTAFVSVKLLLNAKNVLFRVPV